MLEKKFPKPFTFRMTEETFRKVKMLAREQDLSMAQIARQIFFYHFSNQEKRVEKIGTFKEKGGKNVRK